MKYDEESFKKELKKIMCLLKEQDSEEQNKFILFNILSELIRFRYLLVNTKFEVKNVKKN